MTLIQALTQAGGLAPGFGKTIYVLRTGQNGLSEQLAIDVEDLMVTGNPDVNIPLAPNDVINVPMEVPITVYIMGEVVHPGPVSLKRSQNPTLLQAIAAAGGQTDRASRIATIKRTVNGVTKVIRASSADDAPGWSASARSTAYWDIDNSRWRSRSVHTWCSACWARLIR